MEDLKKHIREVPDFPKPGINFYDTTTLLQHPLALRKTVDSFVWLFAEQKIQKVIGIESRGFMFGPSVAYDLNAGFVPVRKPGKLPAEKIRETYDLEYGSDSLEMHADAAQPRAPALSAAAAPAARATAGDALETRAAAAQPGEHVLIVDDLVATGGTAMATARMVEKLGGKVAGFGFIIELTFLDGHKKLEQKGYNGQVG